MKYNQSRDDKIFYDNLIFSDLLKQGFMPNLRAPTGALFCVYK